jgi:hypothetical protein
VFHYSWCLILHHPQDGKLVFRTLFEVELRQVRPLVTTLTTLSHPLPTSSNTRTDWDTNGCGQLFGANPEAVRRILRAASQTTERFPFMHALELRDQQVVSTWLTNEISQRSVI